MWSSFWKLTLLKVNNCLYNHFLPCKRIKAVAATQQLEKVHNFLTTPYGRRKPLKIIQFLLHFLPELKTYNLEQEDKSCTSSAELKIANEQIFIETAVLKNARY